MTRKLFANPAYDPYLHKVQFQRGKEAAEQGLPREPRCCYWRDPVTQAPILGGCFHYSYEGGAWLDGYDSVQGE
jgi:hypothetical protein